jgi:hypothetical protein
VIVANLSPRLLGLIETLVAARLDWLAFELIEGIQIGRPTEESEEALAAARASIRSNAKPRARGEPQPIPMEPVPIPPDEQIEWAAAYVEERLREALEQLQAAIDTLDFVVDGTTDRPDRTAAVAQQTFAPEPEAVAVLLDIEGVRKCGREDVAGARDGLLNLTTALAEWTIQSRGQATTR